MISASEWKRRYSETRDLPTDQRKLIWSDGSLIEAIQLDARIAGLREARELIRADEAQSACLACNEFLANVVDNIGKRITELEKELKP